MDCPYYHPYKQMNLPQFIYEINSVRVIYINGQTQSQQARYSKNYIAIYQTKTDMVKTAKFEIHNQDT